MSMSTTPLPEHPLTYDDGQTKQSFKDLTDINRIVARAAKTGTLSHLEQWGGQYGDFADFDFFEAQNKLAQAKQIFEALPAEHQREFGYEASQFFAYANDPENAGRLRELLTGIAAPGRQFPNPNARHEPPRAEPDPPRQPAPREPAAPATAGKTEPDNG